MDITISNPNLSWLNFAYIFDKKIYLLLTFFPFLYRSPAPSIVLDTRSATVWSPRQTISGSVNNLKAKKVTIRINGFAFRTNVDHGRFSLTVVLRELRNTITVEAIDHSKKARSDTLVLELGFKPLPVVKPFATNQGNIITLHSHLIYNPYGHKLSYRWSSDRRNPASVEIDHCNNSSATAKLPKKHGIYSFHLSVQDGNDSVVYQILVICTDSIHCFNMDKDHPIWIDTAVIYEITPQVFVKDGGYKDIEDKLPELKQLGVNVIWLQPVFKTERKGQGYDVTDFFSLRPDLGNEYELNELIAVAKSLDLKILFDFVPNHTSVFHPYFVDAVRNGKSSHYYNFYQHINDSAKYSSLYRVDSLGFFHYFWNDLVNLNYQNPEVQRWIIEACKYWLKKFDIDGYRFDAMWAVNARYPGFGQELRTELRSIKPDILLLAEDKGSDGQVYEKGFDAAYDWEMDTTWISHWSWQYHYSTKDDLTIFNYPDINKRKDLLSKALFDNGDSLHLRLHFIENNDLPRFIQVHGLGKTKMAAALEFSLPGIPLIYNGQEIGSKVHPYTSKPIFLSDKSIKSLDKDSLFEYYHQLIIMRNQYKSLHSINIKNLRVVPSNGVLAYARWADDEHFIVTINMSNDTQKIKIFIDSSRFVQNRDTTYILKDILSKEIFPVQSNVASINMNGFSTRILMVNKFKKTSDHIKQLN